jgi:iron complex outermembrane recepter protein
MRYVAKSILLLVVFWGIPHFIFSQNSFPDSVELAPVLIQSTRVGKSSPVPHNNLRAEKISRLTHAQDVPYLLGSLPSVVETSDAGTGIGYTGLRIRGSDPTRVNVTINGVPLNDAESQGVFWVNLPDVVASAAEIQVQRGVGSSTNGAGSFGATVNLDLSQVAIQPFAQVSTSLGSFNTQKYVAQFGTGLLKEKWSLGGRISRVNSDGFIDRATADLNGLHLTGAYLGERRSVQLHLLSGHEITYQAWNGVPVQYIDDATLRTFNSGGAERPKSPYQDEVDDYTQRHFMAHYREFFSKKLSLQLNGHYTRGFGFFEQYKADQAYGNYGWQPFTIADTLIQETDLVRRRWLDNDFYGSTFALDWKPNSAWSYLLGGAISRYEGQHFGEIIWAEIAPQVVKDQRYYDNNATKRDANLFLKTEYQFGHAQTALLDLQVRQVQYAFLGYDNALRQVNQTANLLFFNPKAGLSWDISKVISAYGFVGLAHREPNRDDYTQSSPESRPKAERLLDLEGGFKARQALWSLTTNLFWMRYRNQLVLDGRINDVGAAIRTNVPDSYRAGIEIEAAMQPLKSLSLSGNLVLSQNKALIFTAFQDNWDTGEQDIFTFKNTDLAFSPKITTQLQAQWSAFDVKHHALQITLLGKYVGSQFLDNTENENARLSGYFTSDWRLNYDLKETIGQNISLIFSLHNWLNARFENNGWVYRYTSAGYDARPDNPYTGAEGNGVYHQIGLFPQAGRHWMLTLRAKF